MERDRIPISLEVHLGVLERRLLVQGASPAQFLVLDPKTKKKVDVLTKIRT